MCRISVRPRPRVAGSYAGDTSTIAEGRLHDVTAVACRAFVENGWTSITKVESTDEWSGSRQPRIL